MEESWWTKSWREEVNFESTGERERTEAIIDQWLQQNDSPDLETLLVRASTGIPENLSIEEARAAPATTAASIPSAAEKRVHPEFYGPEYDKVYDKAMKNIPGALSAWTKRISKAEVEVAKADGNEFAAIVMQAMKNVLNKAAWRPRPSMRFSKPTR